jgi:hypothetical protein
MFSRTSLAHGPHVDVCSGHVIHTPFLTGFVLPQVITGPNWNDVLASTIRGIGWWAAPYVIFVHVAGGTILLNLLLAILIESFEENTQREQLLRGELRKKFLSAGENKLESC